MTIQKKIKLDLHPTLYIKKQISVNDSSKYKNKIKDFIYAIKIMHIYLSDGKYQSGILSKGFHTETVDRVNNIKNKYLLKSKNNIK